MTRHPTNPQTGMAAAVDAGGQLESCVSGRGAGPIPTVNLLAAAAGMATPRGNVVSFSTRKAWRDDG